MKRNRRFLAVGICGLLLIVMMSATALLAAEIRIEGTIFEEGIVADDGQSYAVAEDEKGKEIMELFGRKVRATGTMEEYEGEKVITVTRYEVIE